MARYSRVSSGLQWGSFVEVKSGFADLLASELGRRRKPGTALLSSVCDPYQPMEKKYETTRRCIRLLKNHGWGVRILTRSPLVLRDVDVLASGLFPGSTSVGISIPTDDDGVRKVTEPRAPSIGSRIETLRRLRDAGLDTWAFVGPMLPMRDPEALAETLRPLVSRVLIDGLHYQGRVTALFQRHGWSDALTPEYARRTASRLEAVLGDLAERA
jgi:DNA repair photolyase